MKASPEIHIDSVVTYYKNSCHIVVKNYSQIKANLVEMLLKIMKSNLATPSLLCTE